MTYITARPYNIKESYLSTCVHMSRHFRDSENWRLVDFSHAGIYAYNGVKAKVTQTHLTIWFDDDPDIKTVVNTRAGLEKCLLVLDNHVKIYASSL